MFLVSVSADTDSGWYSCAAVSESGSCLARAEVAVARDSDRPPPILQLGPVNQVKNKLDRCCNLKLTFIPNYLQWIS
jgi:hypothetical protein